MKIGPTKLVLDWQDQISRRAGKLGADHFRERNKDRTNHHLLRRLRKIGVEVKVIESAA